MLSHPRREHEFILDMEELPSLDTLPIVNILLDDYTAHSVSEASEQDGLDNNVEIGQRRMDRKKRAEVVAQSSQSLDGGAHGWGRMIA